MEKLHVFRDRSQAGRELAALLQEYAGVTNVVVVGLARGGVPVAREIADALGCPLDVTVVRKVGAPGQPELALGAIASGGEVRLNENVRRLDVTDEELAASIDEARSELARRENLYRQSNGALDLKGKIVLLVDDGLATGSSMLAAVHAARRRQAAQVIVCAPVGSVEALRSLSRVADRVVCAVEPKNLSAVSQWYEDFRQTSDQEVQSLLAVRN